MKKFNRSIRRLEMKLTNVGVGQVILKLGIIYFGVEWIASLISSLIFVLTVGRNLDSQTFLSSPHLYNLIWSFIGIIVLIVLWKQSNKIINLVVGEEIPSQGDTNDLEKVSLFLGSILLLVIWAPGFIEEGLRFFLLYSNGSLDENYLNETFWPRILSGATAIMVSIAVLKHKIIYRNDKSSSEN